jgi:hypothetical protein
MKKCRLADLFVCICFVMAPMSRYLKSVNHKIVTWNTNRPRRLYFTIFFNLLFLYFPIFSLNRICCHLFSADNISVFTYNFIHIQFHVIYIKSYIYYPQIFSIKIWKLSKELLNFKTKPMQCPLPNWVVHIGQDAQWNVNKHRICKLCTTDCLFLEIFDFDYEVKMIIVKTYRYIFLSV